MKLTFKLLYWGRFGVKIYKQVTGEQKVKIKLNVCAVDVFDRQRIVGVKHGTVRPSFNFVR
jgi:hypothetical protein